MTPNENTVAYPGREGAHSAVACDRLFPAARLVPGAHPGSLAPHEAEHQFGIDFAVMAARRVPRSASDATQTDLDPSVDAQPSPHG